MSIKNIQLIIEEQKEALRAYGLRRIGIFGSVARHQERATSDIDLLLDFVHGAKTYQNFYASTNFLETLLQRPIDAVTPQAISSYIKPYIDREITYVQISS